jgi:hypothetical protein
MPQDLRVDKVVSRKVRSGRDRASSSCLGSSAKQMLVLWYYCLVEHPLHEPSMVNL